VCAGATPLRARHRSPTAHLRGAVAVSARRAGPRTLRAAVAPHAARLLRLLLVGLLLAGAAAAPRPLGEVATRQQGNTATRRQGNTGGRAARGASGHGHECLPQGTSGAHTGRRALRKTLTTKTRQQRHTTKTRSGHSHSPVAPWPALAAAVGRAGAGVAPAAEVAGLGAGVRVCRGSRTAGRPVSAGRCVLQWLDLGQGLRAAVQGVVWQACGQVWQAAQCAEP
jgi:hypothetical protein